MRLAIIADDLTGAADTGIQFAKRGFYTILLPFGLASVDPSCRLCKAHVLALNTDTRGMQTGLAYDKVKNTTTLLKSLHPQSIYKKIDSTLRGNVGAEIEAVMDATGNDLAILAPAFPACNRATLDGTHFVNGQRLSQTEVAVDPVSPVAESHIPTLIGAQTGQKGGHIDLEEVRRGTKSLQRSIIQHAKSGERIIVFDAATDDDLSNIAQAGMSMPCPPLMVGSAGLANQLSSLGSPSARMSGSRPRRSRGHLHPGSAEPRGVAIIVCGSLSAVTSRQLAELRRTGKVKIIPVEVHRLVSGSLNQPTCTSLYCDQDGRAPKSPSSFRGKLEQKKGYGGFSPCSPQADDQIEEIVSEIISGAKSSRVIGIQSVRERQHAGQNIEARNAGLLSVVEYLGRTALQIVRCCPQAIRGLILSGGDTALAVFRHLGISQVRLVDEILPGIPYGQVVDGEFAGLAIVTKAGAFGDESALMKCVDFLVV